MNEEILKLPICPRCHETKNIQSYDYDETKMSYGFSHSAYMCKSCYISWKFGKGIMDSTIHHCVYGRAILDNREIKMVRF